MGRVIPRVKPRTQEQPQPQKQKQELVINIPARQPQGKIIRGERAPVPNYICYPEAFAGRLDAKGNWLGGRVPKCKRCQGNLQPNENHVCPGFEPQYDEWTQERQDRWDARVAAIREAKEAGVFFEENEDYIEPDYCEGEGDDYVEDDYCEGDED